MKLIVCVKLTPDTEELDEIRPESIDSGDLGVTMVLNPWDEFAVEEALQLQERFEGDTCAITIGGEDAIEALKRAVAMGVEETVFLSDPAFDGSDAWGVAHILAQAIRRIDERALILTGKQSVDGNGGLVAPGLAIALGVPYVSQVAKVLDLTDESVTVLRALDDGVQTVRVHLPAVISVSKEINEPRYPNFMGIRKASRMQYPPESADGLPGLDAGCIGSSTAQTHWTNLRKPAARAGRCEFVEGSSPAELAAALVEKLLAEKVL